MGAGSYAPRVVDEADAQVVRRFYAAVAAHDLDAAAACFADDVVWHLPGKSPIAGAHRGWAGIREDFLAKLDPLSGGTFRVELLDVAIGAEFVVAVQRATATRDERRPNVIGRQLISVVDGSIAAVRGHYSDQEAFDHFWS
jgi:ketosteroid isomerase-like protein